MLKADRDTIEVNLANLVRATSYARLMECCLERQILFQVMRDKIEVSARTQCAQHNAPLMVTNRSRRHRYAFVSKRASLTVRCPVLIYASFRHVQSTNDTEAKRHRALFRKLMHRGPDAFAALKSLCQVEFPGAMRHLLNEVSIHKSAVKPAAVNHRPAAASAPTTTTTTTTTTDVRPGYRPDTNQLHVFNDRLDAASAFANVQHSTRLHGTEPEDELGCYPMQSPNRGVAFLVNIINFRNRPKEPRLGADVDKVNLVQLFRQMGFTVMYYENRTAVVRTCNFGGNCIAFDAHRPPSHHSAQELRELLNELRNSDWLRTADCFVMALMTHGTMVNEVAKVEFYDNSFLDLNEVLGYFSNINSQALHHKPKIFLFPFCRGNTLEKPLYPVAAAAAAAWPASTKTKTASDAALSNDAVAATAAAAAAAASLSLADSGSVVPTYSDMKICYATGPGFEAMREPDTGSWYIESMCGIWARNAHNRSLDELLMMVGHSQLNKQSSDGNIQTAHNEDRGFFRKLYFNPGYPQAPVPVPVPL